MPDYILNLLPLSEEEKAQFEAVAPDATHVYAGRRTVTPEQLAQATVVFGWIRPNDLKDAAQLKWFQTMWAGTNEYAEAVKQDALFTSSSGSNSQSVSEHMFASLLSLCRKLPVYRDHQRQHIWKDEGTVKTLSGSTVLVVGAGNVGAAFGRLCQAMGAYTIGLKRSVATPVPGFDRLDTLNALDALLPTADVVALTLPHTPETVHLINGQRIALMKDDAILISSGRGSVLDQDALVAAMNGGKLWGAAMDVTEPEPLPADHPLWDIPNLIITPHTAGGMRLEITRKNCINMALDNLKRYLSGDPLHNLVAH